MAEALKKDEALAAAVREAFQRHMEAARLASQAAKDKQTATATTQTAARDPRLAVPAPANDMRTAALAETKPAAPRAPSDTVSLKDLVAVASPRREIEPKAVSKPVESSGNARQPALPPVVEVKSEPEVGFDFGEALFIEIAPETERKPVADLPKMPKAASLDTPLREPLSQRGADDLEFRQPPLRERPRMSTASPGAGAPQDLDLTAVEPAATTLEPVESKDNIVKDPRFIAPPAATKPSKRFGVATPARPAAANANLRTRSKKIGFKVPAALVASAAMAIVIAGVGGYFWNNPDRLQALSALVAPPASQDTKTALATPDSKPASDDAKIDASLPADKPVAVASAPPPPAPAAPPPVAVIAPVSVPPAVPAVASRSVSTVAITLDEVDEAVQSARELTAMGNIDEARQALDSYKNGSDPRALFALAETYDPAVVKDVGKADAAQAKAYYEAAAKAGSQDNTADRIARLALAHTN